MGFRPHFTGGLTITQIESSLISDTTFISNLFSTSTAITQVLQRGAGYRGRTNSWITGEPYSAAGGSTTPQRGALYVMPIYLAANVTIDQWAAQINGTSAGSPTFRALLYNAGLNGYPTTLAADLGTMDLSTATTGQPAFVTVADTPITAGYYWIGGIAQGAAIGSGFVQSGTDHISTVPKAWYLLGATSTIRADYSAAGATGGAASLGASVIGLAAFNSATDRGSVPDPFPTYTGRVNLPATTDVGTCTSIPLVALHVK